MNDVIVKMIQVSLVSVVFYMFYMLVLRDRTFFASNRVFLLGAGVFSFVLPFLKLPVPDHALFSQTTILLDEVMVRVSDEEQAGGRFALNFMSLYYVVMAVFIGRIALGLVLIQRLLWQSRIVWYNEQKLYVCSKDVNPFSIFRCIVISEDTYACKDSLQRIIIHEQAHVKQGHGIDVLVYEIVCAIGWINPVFWLLKKEIKSTHEYLADKKVIEHGFDLAKYFMLIFDSVIGVNVVIANNFNQSLNIKRMKMMKKKSPTLMSKVMSLSALPVVFCLALVLLAQCTSVKNTPVTSNEEEVSPTATDDQVFMVVQEMPSFPGGEAAMMQYLRSSVKYPAKAQEKGLEGRVYVEFIVNKDGSISDASILKGAGQVLDEEALRVIMAMPNWVPGKQRGKLVRVKYRLPINFTLRATDKAEKD